MHTLPSRPSLPSLRIDGVEHRLSALTVLDATERLPGGLTWLLEFDEAAARQFLTYAPDLKDGRPSYPVAHQVFAVLRKVLHQPGRPRFCVATVDRIAVRGWRVRLTGRCAPLIVEASGASGLTRSCH